MLDSLTSKVAGLPVYLWVLVGAAGLYVFAHYKGQSKVQGVAPLENISSKQPFAPISPTATVITYNPTPMGSFGGSNPYGGVPTR